MCLNIGRPGIIVTSGCRRLVDVAGESKTKVVAKLGQVLIDLHEIPPLQLAGGARQRYRDFYSRIYGEAV